MKKPTLPPHLCGRCPARWFGMAMAHCARCHKTFTGVTAFTAHRVGPLADRSCDLSKLTEIRPGIYGQAEPDRPFYKSPGVRQ